MNSLLESDRKFAHHGCHCQAKPKKVRPRHLHQSTLHFGETAPCYITTHSQSYSGRSADGHPLQFHLRDPSFPSQHRTWLDLSDITMPLQWPPQSVTKEVHGHKQSRSWVDQRVESWARHRSGRDVRELLHPEEPSQHQTIYKTEHRLPVTDSSSHRAGGRPTQWHQHNILTGETRRVAGPGKPIRRSKDELLWAARRWETDCCALRLC